MLRTLKRVGNDILHRKNLEIYITSLAAFIVALASFFENLLSDDIKLAVLLGGMGLLVFKLSEPKTEQSLELEDVLKDRQSYGKFGDFIHNANTLWIYGASNINVLRNIDEIRREVLDHGGKVRILMQDPNETASMDILYRQLDKVHDLRGDIEAGQGILRRIKDRLKNGTIEYRFLAYSPGFSMTVVDPDGKDGRLIVEFYGYENEQISDRMHIEIHRSQSQHWIEHWERQYRLMWDQARQPDA